MRRWARVRVINFSGDREYHISVAEAEDLVRAGMAYKSLTDKSGIKQIKMRYPLANALHFSPTGITARLMRKLAGEFGPDAANYAASHLREFRKIQIASAPIARTP